MHSVHLKLNELPLLSSAGSVTAESDFIHQDRVMKEHVLIYLYRGEMEIIEDGETHLLRSGECLFLKAGVHHWGKRVIAAGTSWFYVHFSASDDLSGYRKYDDYAAVLKRQNFEEEDFRYYLTLPKQAHLPSRSRIDRRIQDLLALYDSSEPIRIAHINAALYELLADIYQAATEGRRADKADMTVRKLIAFLEQHNTGTVSSEEIAAQMRLSYKYLCTVFRSKTGLSINQYHTHLRINEAARLLRETSLNISEVSYAVGYRDPLYFSGVFKRIMGEPPSEYLRQTFQGAD